MKKSILLWTLALTPALNSQVALAHGNHDLVTPVHALEHLVNAGIAYLLPGMILLGIGLIASWMHVRKVLKTRRTGK